MHLVLFGDSIFDNQVYVRPGPDVITQVRSLLTGDDKATLLAFDGHTTQQLPHQLKRVDDSMTHFVISIGGNDALGHLGVLQKPSSTVAASLLQLAKIHKQFEQDYRNAISQLLSFKRPTAICTLYKPRYDDPVAQTAIEMAVPLLNDVVYRVASEYGVPLLDLRAIFTRHEDYANPIEPSAIGGAKLAQAIVTLFTQHNFDMAKTVIWP